MSEVRNVLLRIKGRNCRVVYCKSLSLRKEHQHLLITKTTEANFRAGTNKDAMKATISAREMGELPSENQGLKPGWSWVDFPHILHYAPKGQDYFRFYPASGAKTPSRIVYRNETTGEEITKEQALMYCLASEVNEREKKDSDCYNIPECNIISINGVENENYQAKEAA